MEQVKLSIPQSVVRLTQMGILFNAVKKVMSTEPLTTLRFLGAAIMLAALAFTGTAAEPAGLGQTPASPRNLVSAGADEIRILPVRDNVYVLFGAGGNITVSIGRDGVLLVDTGAAEMTDRVLAAINQLRREAELKEAASGRRFAGIDARDPNGTRKPIGFIINTSSDLDHTGGNAKLGGDGRERGSRFAAGRASIIAHENALLRMTAVESFPSLGLPTSTYFGDEKRMSSFFNGEGIQIIHQRAAHTDGDSIVHFRKSDVIAAGDLFLTTTYPVIDLAAGGSIQGIIDSLNGILDRSVAEFRMQGGTVIVPGHGRLSDAADVAYYRDMVTIIRDRIRAMVNKGMTVDQVKAAKPTADYDPRYGATTGAWTTDKFIEAVYASIKSGASAKTSANN